MNRLPGLRGGGEDGCLRRDDVRLNRPELIASIRAHCRVKEPSVDGCERSRITWKVPDGIVVGGHGARWRAVRLPYAAISDEIERAVDVGKRRCGSACGRGRSHERCSLGRPVAPPQIMT